MQSINLFKQYQVFRYTLYLHDVQKLASIPYSSLCLQINEKCFRKYDNHKFLRRNGRKQKFTKQNKELGTLRNGFAEY